MIRKEDIRIGYEYFYQKVYGNPKYVFNFSSKSEKAAETLLNCFTEKYGRSSGLNQLYYYFSNRFEFWSQAERTVTDFSQRVIPSLIFSNKEFKRFTQRDIEWDWMLEGSDFITEHKISRVGFLRYIKEKEGVSEVQTIEKDLSGDRYRKLYYNTLRGLIECELNTTMFMPTNILCVLCNNRKECKEILRVNLPEVFEKRCLKKD